MQTSGSLLDFESNRIDLSVFPDVLTDALLEEIIHVLSSNETVMHVDFSNNNITSEMADRIGYLLTVNSVIRSLALTNCGLTDGAASTILRCARKFKVLQSIHLSRNSQLTNVCVTELEKLITASTVLTEVTLMDTSITFEGALKIVEAMIVNTSLLYCSLPFVVGHALLAEVQKLLERNWLLQKHVERAAQTVETLKSLVKREEELKAEKWKMPVISPEDVGSSHRVFTATATRDEWVDPTAKTHLLYLTLLDRKAAFDHANRVDRERKKQQLLCQAVTPRRKASAVTSSPRTLPSLSPRGRKKQ